MNTKKTVNAFTLVEMVIVLIIASLIVALSFTVLDIVQRNLGNISKQFSVENNRILLQSRLEANFLKYGESYYDRNKEQIVFRNNIIYVLSLFIRRPKNILEIMRYFPTNQDSSHLAYRCSGRNKQFIFRIRLLNIFEHTRDI